MSLSLDIVCSKNEGLALSPSELRDLYMFGIKILDERGNELSDSTYIRYLKSAQEEVEKTLNIKVQKTRIEESRDFFLDEFRQWSLIRTSYPVNKPCSLLGKINEITQIEYPTEWLVAKKDNKGRFYRIVNVVPNQGGHATISGVVYSGVTPHIGLRGLHFIPQYWRINYVTGYDVVPADLIDYIGKLAAIKLFYMAGDLILGPGISNTSISIDGLSQSLGTNQGFKMRIEGYENELKRTVPIMKAYYRGLSFTAL